jgi:outer membrane protein assembly factor BamB
MKTRSTVFAMPVSLFLAGLTGCGQNAETATPAAPAALPKAAAGDWPWWRGPALDGTSAERDGPTKWSTTENVVWKASVPGRGHSSPVVCGDRVFLTTADEKTQRQLVLAFDRQTGQLLWSTPVYQGGFPRKNPKNSHASATLACDGERLYCAFVNHDALHVTATELHGKVLWQKDAGAFQSEHGYGSSPVLWGSMVIVNGDSLKGSFLAALDRRDGKLIWRTERKATGRHGSYATPTVAQLAGRPQLILTGTGQTTGYDPDNGKLIWSCEGPSEVTACTPACSDTLVFVTGGYPEKELLAIRADGTGDVTKSAVAWRTGKGVAYVPSPVYHDGRLYVVADTGLATCFEAATGKQVWQDRLAGNFSASPVLAGERLYATNESGKTYVVKTGPKIEIAAVNDLGDGGMASPAVCGGQIFLRTQQSLYCIGSGVAPR